MHFSIKLKKSFPGPEPTVDVVAVVGMLVNVSDNGTPHGGTSMDGTADMELVRAAGNGSQAAWRELLRIHEKPLLAAVARKIGADEAEDIVQETFVCLLRRVKAFDGRIPLSAWLMMVANRRCADLYRKRGRMKTVALPQNPVGRGESPDEIVVRKEHVAVVREAIAAELGRIKANHGSRCKQQAVESLLAGDAPVEAAERFGCSNAQAATWGFESRRQMRKSEALAGIAAEF